MSSKNLDLKSPVAKVIPRKFTIHGIEIVDNYYWFKEKSNPEVIEYLEAENKYTKVMKSHTEEFQGTEKILVNFPSTSIIQEFFCVDQFLRSWILHYF